MKFNSISPQIIHMTMEYRDDLAGAMIRFQEYYESPFPDIKGKIFTLGQIKAKGSRNNPGVNTYCGGVTFGADWSGYNVPDYAFDPFIKGLFDPLTDAEKDIVEVVRYRTDKFYFIATYGDDDPGESLEHEIRHAMYYIDAGYRAEVISTLNEFNLVALKLCLKSWGYAEEVLNDECHAYMGSDYHWFFGNKDEDVKKFGIKVDSSISDRLNDIADRYKEKLKIGEK